MRGIFNKKGDLFRLNTQFNEYNHNVRLMIIIRTFTIATPVFY